MTSRYPNVVLGGGAVGLATSLGFARLGEPVLLVERSSLGHDRGSSHGAARIIRHSYADPDYALRMPEAFAAWRAIEVEAAEPLIVRIGGVSTGPSGSPYLAGVAANLASLGIPLARRTGREWNAAHPAFGLADDAEVVFEPDAGLIRAARSLEVFRRLARSIGPKTEIRDRTPVARVDLEATRPTLILADGSTLHADRLVVAAGPWTARLVPELAADLIATRQAVFHLRPADLAPYSLGQLPAFIAIEGDESALRGYYGMPGGLGLGPGAGQGVKVARHGGPVVDPDAPMEPPGPVDLEPIREFLRTILPGLADAPIERAETCLYTMAAGDRFRVARPGGRADCLVASPCSGHGFKFAPLVGSTLAAMAIEGSTRLDPGQADWLEIT